MGYLLDRLNKKIEERKKRESEPLTPEILTNLTLTEFARRNIAVEIYSEVLKCNLWLCSDEEMKAQVERDAPGQVCYTVPELRNLLKLNPSPESLKSIHAAKEILPGLVIKSANNANKGTK